MDANRNNEYSFVGGSDSGSAIVGIVESVKQICFKLYNSVKKFSKFQADLIFT